MSSSGPVPRLFGPYVLTRHLGADPNVVGFTAAGPVAGVRVGDRTVLNPVEAAARTERAGGPCRARAAVCQ